MLDRYRPGIDGKGIKTCYLNTLTRAPTHTHTQIDTHIHTAAHTHTHTHGGTLPGAGRRAVGRGGHAAVANGLQGRYGNSPASA